MSIISNGYTAFRQAHLVLPITISETDLKQKNYRSLVRNALYAQFPEITSRKDKRALARLLSQEAPYTVEQFINEYKPLAGQTLNIILPFSAHVDQYLKGNITVGGKISKQMQTWIETLKSAGLVEMTFNWRFFSSGDSREPELAGIKGALVGSLMTMIITFTLSFIIGVMTAIYLEEFTKKNRLSHFIEVNLNNLASVPSIVFGLLGLMVFLVTFNLPRSAPLVGGLVLTLMTLPTIVIASRAALKAVPPSLKEGALAMGATHMQAVFQHQVPYAMPGILTGSIIGIAQALGETAPLLMIGMVAFVMDVPQHITDVATVLPVQIYIWADSPERAFAEKTAAAIMVLLAFLIALNLLAVILRKKLERRW